MRIRVVGALIAVLACATLSSCTSTRPSNDEPQILEFVGRFIRSVNEANVDDFVACFSADATAFFPSAANASRRKGHDAIRAAVAPAFARGRPVNPVNPRELTISSHGSLAYVTFDGGNALMHARRSLILRRHKDTWLIVHLHASNVDEAR
jgi:ketosteroid isomerase-like protein